MRVLNLTEGDLWESETIGDNQLLITFTKLNRKKEERD